MKPAWFLLLFVFSCNKKTPIEESLILARVNDFVLTVDQLEQNLSPRQRSKDQIRAYIHDWVNNTVVFQEARKRGLDKDKSLLNKSSLFFTKLVVSAYLETETTPLSEITKNQIRNYYEENSSEFVRVADDATIHHFMTDNISEARNIRKKLIKKRTGEIMEYLFSLYSASTKTVKRGRLIKDLDNLIFNNEKTGVFGPVKIKENYHIVDILKINKRGSRIGLEDAYDEIYQRIMKQNRVVLTTALIDSLRKKSNIFINDTYN
tara:strand:+ start:539 stop:1327 length:789 start_codon:yes stop_codon:yes gene_type:complete